MSLLNETKEAYEARHGFEPIGAPPLPGEGPVVYLQGAGPLLIVARHAEGELLCNVWSWFVNSDRWERCWLA